MEETKLEINNEGVRALNIIAVDTTAKTITVKYGGAYSGTYEVRIKSLTNGYIETSATPLQVVFEITDISPLTGSIFGGSLITVSGGPFTTDLKETIVKVGYKWWEGIDHYCYVVSATESQVTCRLPLDLNREAKEYEVIAFAATYEESNCMLANNCLFTFLAAADLPEVTGFTVEFDASTYDYQITVSGTGFTDAANQIDFMLAGEKQTVLSATSTDVVINVDSVKAGLEASKMDLYFAVGIPNGYTELLEGATFMPKLIELSVNTISEAGSTIQATIKGVGIEDGVTLVDAAGKTDLCLTSIMKGYA